MDKKLLARAVYLDMKKAFDIVDYKIVLKKLLSLGIMDNELSWFQDYLHDKSECFHIDNTDSNYRNMNCSVPHGSILDPLLFILYLNDLPNWLQNSELHIVVNCLINSATLVM